MGVLVPLPGKISMRTKQDTENRTPGLVPCIQWPSVKKSCPAYYSTP